MQRGEIYFVDLNPIIGREQGGRRPVLVVSSAVVLGKPLVITVVPGTDGSRIPTDFPENVRVPAAESSLKKETVFLCFQIRALDPSRFTDPPVGSLSATRMQEVSEALKHCLEIA